MYRFVLLALLGAVVLSGCGDEAEAPAIEGGPEHRLALEVTSIRVSSEPPTGGTTASLEMKVRVYFREDAIDATRWGLPAEWTTEYRDDDGQQRIVELMRTAIDDEHCPADLGPGEECTITLHTYASRNGRVSHALAIWLSPVRGTKPALVPAERTLVKDLIEEWDNSQQ